MSDRLDGFTIYENPSDRPGHYVLRGWSVGPTGDVVHERFAISMPIGPKALAALRQGMVEQGFVRIPRSDDDEPQILETWV